MSEKKTEEIIRECFLKAATEKMKHERTEIDDFIYELIEIGLLELDIKKEVLDIEEKIIYEELTHYFDGEYMKDIETRMKNPEITVEEVIKELEENVKRKD